MKTILVPLDGSPFSEHALPAAIAIARRRAMRLALVHVHQIVASNLSPAGVPFFDPSVDTIIHDEEDGYLKKVAERIAAVWDGQVSQEVLYSPITEALCSYAQEIGAELIVLCSHGRGSIARAWMGSVTDRVIRHAQIPTLVIRPSDGEINLSHAPAMSRILIPLDGSPLAEQAIAMAEALGGDPPAHYDLVRVVEPALRGPALGNSERQIDTEAQEAAWHDASAYLEGIAAPLRERGHVVMTYAPVGHVASAILERAEADAIDMIAMSTHGRGAVARMMMGSVADKVLRATSTPLLIYRPPLEEPAAPDGTSG
ncbi:universal stress protein [Oscillochloris sp. ZM17-4]|uniref:universal stress protein n=1 Tax=Oscillochloris sp. ZM17-4 TaxID=2866714 RepID=UPI001C735588|nr:universal stress protein [Oscillochloris sp. ZM17-4]MBX0329947.1 universal stress protein [Oscillochloris sp. ZM17-4]